MRPEGLLTERSALICFPSEKGEKYWVRKPDGELEKEKKALLRLLPWVKGSLSRIHVVVAQFVHHQTHFP